VSAQTTPPTYSTRAGDAITDRGTVLAIWRGNLGQDARMAAKYDWFYRRAPAGTPLLQFLTRADLVDAVGVGAAGRRRMLRDGNEVHAGLMVDLAVTPEHRSLGPALILQQALFAAARRDLDLLYCFPNPKAAPVFKRIGYRHVADIIRYVHVVRHARYLHRRLPRLPSWLAAPIGGVIDCAFRLRHAWRWPASRKLRAQWRDRVPDIDPLWNASPKPQALTALRDAAHLRWRFDDAPVAEGQASFRHLQLFEGETSIAWFATRADGQILHVHDFWSRDGAQLSPEIIAALLRAARGQGYPAVSVELATSEARLQPWLRLGFESRGQRPVFGVIGAASADDSIDLHLTSADEDE
jgi:GNAT superfamily N-acetyltransferase